jgi:hypothetical protein
MDKSKKLSNNNSRSQARLDPIPKSYLKQRASMIEELKVRDSFSRESNYETNTLEQGIHSLFEGINKSHFYTIKQLARKSELTPPVMLDLTGAPTTSLSVPKPSQGK